MKESRDTFFFPILINLQKIPCLVVGGGEVASRKVSSLLEFNADVTVMSPEISNFLDHLFEKGEIRLIRRPYSKEYLKEFKIVFCATNSPDTDQRIYEDCRKEGIFINVADTPSLCDFILPANIKRGSLTISISSQGKAPFFVKEMKRRLNSIIPPVYAKILELAGDYRRRVLGNGSRSATSKAEMFNRFTEIDWEAVLKEKGEKPSQKYLEEILQEFEQ